MKIKDFHIFFLFIGVVGYAIYSVAQMPTVRFVDSEGKTLDEAQAVLHAEQLYVPLDTVKTVFDPEMTHRYSLPTKQLTLKTKGKQLLLQINDSSVSIDSGRQIVTLPAPPRVIRGEPMLPIAFFYQLLPLLDNVEVRYNSNLQRIRIMSKTEQAPNASEDKQEWTVIIDPGHGGEDDLGCESQAGLLEKDIVLLLAKEIQILSEQQGLSIRLTRARDVKKTRIQRIQSANRNRGQLFLSLHCNASFSPNDSGMQLYLNNPNGLLRFQNPVKSAFSRERLRLLPQPNFLSQSREFATLLQKELDFMAEKPVVINELPIVALADASMPAVLLELGFLTNTADVILLSNHDHINELAAAILRAIQVYSAAAKPPADAAEQQENEQHQE